MNTRNAKTDTPLMDKIAMFLLAVYPIIDYYMPPVGPFSYGQLSMVLFVVCSILIQKNIGIKYTNGFVVLWVYAALTTLFFHGEIKATNFIPGGISFCMFALCLGVFPNRFSYRYLKKYLRVISIVSILIFVVQEIMYYYTGARFAAILPFEKTSYSDITYQELCINQMYNLRSSSIFMEPSYFAQYMLIVLCVELFDCDRSKLFNPYSLILIVTIVLSRSGSGMIGLGLLLFYFFYNAKTNGRINGYDIIFLLLFIVGLLYFWSSSELGSVLMNRSAEFENEDTSGYMRSVRGFLIFNNLPFINKIFGISLADFSKIGVSLGVYSGTGLLVNGFQNVLIALGGLGLFFLISFYYYIYLNTSSIGKASIILLLCISLVESIYLSPSMLLLTVIAASFYSNTFNRVKS